MYKVRSTSGKHLKFSLCDTRGLEDGQGIGANDIGYILDGNLPDGFQVLYMLFRFTFISSFLNLEMLYAACHIV